MRPALTALLVAACAAATARAETMLTAQANMTLEYNDNLRFQARDAREDWQRAAFARGILAIERPNDALSLSPAVRVRRYQDETVLDSEDWFLDFAAQRAFENSMAQLSASWHRDAALTSEFDGLRLNEVGVERESWSLQPSWSRDLTPWVTTRIGVSHNEVRYERAVALVDYSVNAGSWSFTREMDEGEQAMLTLSASRLEAPTISNRADQLGVQLDYSRALGEKTQLSLTLGARRSDFEQAFAPARSDSGLLFGFTVAGEREYGKWDFSLSRTVDPSGTGTVVQTDSASASCMREWGPSLNTTLRIVVSDMQDLQGINPGDDRRYGQFRAGLGWTFTPNWSLAAEYRLVGQHADASGLGAVSNAVTLTLSWRSEGIE